MTPKEQERFAAEVLVGEIDLTSLKEIRRHLGSPWLAYRRYRKDEIVPSGAITMKNWNRTIGKLVEYSILRRGSDR